MDGVGNGFFSVRLKLNELKIRIVNLREVSEMKFDKSFDFLGFTIKPNFTHINNRMMLVPSTFISKKVETRILEKFRAMNIPKWRCTIEEVAQRIQPIHRVSGITPANSHKDVCVGSGIS